MTVTAKKPRNVPGFIRFVLEFKIFVA
jgi:hypothetical protein